MNILLLIAVFGLIFVNGWTDAPNAIAGLVATGGMRYRSAAWMAAVCNLAGALLFCLASGRVARTVFQLADFSRAGSGGIAALCGCFLAVILFASAAWVWGIPTSESHGLMAGILGGSLALGRADILSWRDWQPVFAGLFLSVGLGFFCGLVLQRLLGGGFSHLSGRRLDFWQRAGAAAGAFVHGAQDGQKFAAVLWLALCLSAPSAAEWSRPPLLVVVACAAAMGAGTRCGGRRIIQKTAVEMVRIDKVQSVLSDLAGALALTVLSLLGMPASTTHTKTASMAGCASATSRSALDWRIAGQMIFAWLLTFPLCALLSFLLTKLLLRFPI